MKETIPDNFSTSNSSSFKKFEKVPSTLSSAVSLKLPSKRVNYICSREECLKLRSKPATRVNYVCSREECVKLRSKPAAVVNYICSREECMVFNAPTRGSFLRPEQFLIPYSSYGASFLTSESLWLQNNYNSPWSNYQRQMHPTVSNNYLRNETFENATCLSPAKLANSHQYFENFSLKRDNGKAQTNIQTKVTVTKETTTSEANVSYRENQENINETLSQNKEAKGKQNLLPNKWLEKMGFEPTIRIWWTTLLKRSSRRNQYGGLLNWVEIVLVLKSGTSVGRSKVLVCFLIALEVLIVKIINFIFMGSLFVYFLFRFAFCFLLADCFEDLTENNQVLKKWKMKMISWKHWIMRLKAVKQGIIFQKTFNLIDPNIKANF